MPLSRMMIFASAVGTAWSFGRTPTRPDAKTCPDVKTYMPQEPAIPGVMPGITKPSILLAQDIDWPPYAYLANPPEGDYTVTGFGFDVAMGLKEVCDIDVEVTQADWAGCWGNDKIGPAAMGGLYHGCMTYTHTIGARPRYMDFTHAILENNKPGGLLTLLTDGIPHVSPMSDLSGKKVVDVNGWAPTKDGLALSENVCIEGSPTFTGYEWVYPTNATKAMYEGENDRALKTLLNGEADAMWVYADQMYTYDCARDAVDRVQASWDCDMWSGLGTKFAYIHTGLFDTAVNGTTLAMSKRGSKLSTILNPCIDKFLRTKDYYEICKKHDFVNECYANEHFPMADKFSRAEWELPTNQHTSCSTGYCGCEGI